jgi:glycosyltransferase involved in cell wall biosynthesis
MIPQQNRTDWMFHGRRIAVVIPALNEEKAIGRVLADLPTFVDRAIVVDNGSTDRTAEVARELGATVVHEPLQGFGAACWAGLNAATAEVVCFMDADASFDPTELPRVADPVAAGDADLVMGARDAERGSWPWHARLANKVLAAEIRRRSGVAVSDLGPMRAARRTELLELGLTDRRSGWPLEMVLRAHAAGWRIEEVHVSYRPRIGRSKVTGTVKGTMRAITDMSRLLAGEEHR